MERDYPLLEGCEIDCWKSCLTTTRERRYVNKRCRFEAPRREQLPLKSRGEIDRRLCFLELVLIEFSLVVNHGKIVGHC